MCESYVQPTRNVCMGWGGGGIGNEDSVKTNAPGYVSGGGAVVVAVVCDGQTTRLPRSLSTVG